MNSLNQPSSPIVEFLGADAGAGGPFALLGLEHTIVSDEQVIKACRRRLNQIDRHPQRSTPNADEVRLALHSATSQLLNHDLREQLAKRWPPGVPVSLPKAWVPKQRARQLKPGIINKARMMIGASGGWNGTARKRLVHLARINRVTALELVSALGAGSTSKSSGNDQQSTNSSTAKPQIKFDLIDNAPSNASSWFPAFAILFIMAAAVVSTILLEPSNQFSSLEVAENQLQNDLVGLNSRSMSSTPSASSNVPRDEFGHYTALAHELDQIAAKAQARPIESVERFQLIYPLFVERWTLFPEAALSRSSLNIAGFTRLIAESDIEEDRIVSLFAKVSEDGEYPQQIMIRAAILDVLLSEYRLSSTLRTKLGEARSACVDGIAHPSADIHSSLGLIAGLQGVESTTDNSDWWKAWLEGVSAFTTENKSLRTRLVLSVLSARLRKSDPLDSQWKETSITLANSLSWKSESTESFWLLSQFNDEAVNTPRLAALTEAIATASQASKINIQMVLNPAATLAQRQDLAKQYKAAWGSGQSDSEVPTQLASLISELHFTVSLTPPKVAPNDAMRSYVKLARLNSAMWQYAQGRTAQAAETLATYERNLPSTDTAAEYSMSLNARDTLWAESAINAETPETLRSLFDQLRADNGGGINSAHALVYLSTLHANADIRATARSQVLRYRDRPSILIALDYAATNNRVSTRLAQLVSDTLDIALPKRTDDAWYPAVHQAFVSRLSNSLSLAMDSQLNSIEQESRIIYRSRLKEQSSFAESEPSAIESARRLFRQSLRELDFTNAVEFQERVKQIEALTLVRVERSKSPVHVFLAYQRSVCAIKALYVEQSLPGRSHQVQDLLAELDARLSQSDTVLNQLIQVEQCIAKLWVLSYQGGNS